MIPILYEKTETAFTSNGLGRLSDCIRCIATEERNGIYEVEFDYPVTGILFSEIQEGRIIACTHDEQGDIQPFDIYARSEPINGVVTFYAHHISYRLSGITVKPFTAGSCAEALSKIKTQSVTTNPFTFWTNKSVTAQYTSERPKIAKGMLAGEEGSILDIYGTGEYEYDKFNVKLHLHRGQDTNVSIRYGKNLIDYTNEYDVSDAYTAVVPYWLGEVTEEGAEESTQVLVMLPELFITSGHSVPSGREVVVPMDLSDEFEDAPTVAELRTRAQSRLASSDAWLPNQTVTVDFVQLWQTEEYADYAPLQRLRLCDTCGVFVPMYDTALRLKIIRVTYNVLLDRYDQMELGDKPTTYTAVLEKMYDSKVAGVEAGLKSIAVDIQT
ncbi:MAG: phage tail spike protein, partial [Acutalibacteraceae bacterium]|nr:phage tail spike protein [Acutalibacteraceae bacterium]